ncbi:molybdenum cofactor guanylyltransferase [Devosia naphthalenivorans]|uniref:molybdenum cofactor guanylyltransferase n=1 Tax=Devosia naphthalenivorans TaxID=2082392 RepID=UPI000D3951A2|nr:NTP transferase domain-containing protein [Devosia naphthalenivorans]
MSAVHAVIIAGGEGQRLGGVRKADLRIGGVRLIDRVAAKLAQAERPLLVSTGRIGRELALPPYCEPISDLPGAGGGPLAGLVAAVQWLRSKGVQQGVLVSVAVDTPFLPDDYVSRLVAGLAHAPVAFGAWGANFYPPNAAWELAAIQDLQQGETSLKRLQRVMGGQRIGWDEMEDNPFDNLNTLADLVALGKRARQKPLL